METRKNVTINSAVFYASFMEAGELLPDADRLSFYDAVFSYAFTGTVCEMTKIANALFITVKPQMDANRARYENGCKGGRPRNQKESGEEPNDNQTETEEEPKQNQDKTKTKPNSNLSQTKGKPNYDYDYDLDNIKAPKEKNNNSLIKCANEGASACACDSEHITRMREISQQLYGSDNAVDTVLKALGELDLLPPKISKGLFGVLIARVQSNKPRESMTYVKAIIDGEQNKSR